MRGIGFLLLGWLVGCQTAPDTAIRPKILGAVPSLTVPRTHTPPAIDGLLDEETWKGAAKIVGLLPSLGVKDADQIAKIPTTVRVLWDERYLYVSYECVDDEIYCTGTKKHDDLLYVEDVCEVFLDGIGDGRQFVELQVNPEGVNLDLMYLFTKAAEYTPEMRLTQALCETDRWKFLEWEMKGLRTAGQKIVRDNRVIGWSVELAIPAETIMKRKGSATFYPTEIRANFVRYDWPISPVSQQRELLQQNWSPVLLGNPHNSPARMGRLKLRLN